MNVHNNYIYYIFFIIYSIEHIVESDVQRYIKV